MDLQTAKKELAKPRSKLKIPEHVKAGIERGRKHAEDGKLTPQDEVMNNYAKYQDSLL